MPTKCPKGKIMNPVTKRCVKTDGKIGKELLAKKSSSSKPSLSKNSSSSSNKCSKECLKIVISLLPFLQAQSDACISLNYGKYIESKKWYDTEMRIRSKDGKYKIKIFKDNKWENVNNKSQSLFTEQELVDIVSSIKCKEVVMMLDKLNGNQNVLILWH